MICNFKKSIVESPKFYISKFQKNEDDKYLMFIHGGPGFNSKVVEHLIENEKLFDNLNFNLVLYDQRGCGRSKDLHEPILHDDNVNDLNELVHYLSKEQSIQIKGLIGHSYGAKILFDFQNKFKMNIPSIFVSTADSILTPRLNNLNLDFLYLKRTNPDKYKEIVSKMDIKNLNSLWEITEELSPFFSVNPDRKLAYWSNLDYYEKIKSIDPEINNRVFSSVRKDLYSKESNFSVDISSLKIKKIWVNGFHDFIMDGSSDAFLHKDKKVFYKSSHYPHIEENNLFCETVNEFMKDV